MAARVKKTAIDRAIDTCEAKIKLEQEVLERLKKAKQAQIRKAGLLPPDAAVIDHRSGTKES